MWNWNLFTLASSRKSPRQKSNFIHSASLPPSLASSHTDAPETTRPPQPALLHACCWRFRASGKSFRRARPLKPCQRNDRPLMCQKREKNRPRKIIVNVYNGFIIYFVCYSYKRRAGWSVKTIEYKGFLEDFRRRQSGFGAQVRAEIGVDQAKWWGGGVLFLLYQQKIKNDFKFSPVKVTNIPHHVTTPALAFWPRRAGWPCAGGGPC